MFHESLIWVASGVRYLIARALRLRYLGLACPREHGYEGRFWEAQAVGVQEPDDVEERVLDVDQAVQLSGSRVGHCVGLVAEPLEPAGERGVCFQSGGEGGVPDALVAPRFPVRGLEHDLSERALLVAE